MKTLWIIVLFSTASFAGKITLAAAADLKFAMDDIAVEFRRDNPYDTVEIVFGSSGKFYTQIREGAPFDLFFSADISYPRGLVDSGFAASKEVLYALGRIVLWSTTFDASKWTLQSLLGSEIHRVAIANPKHAPYGKRAEEALRASGVWEKIEPKLVYGENISITSQYVQTGNAQAGIIALSLAMSPSLSKQGGYWLVPDRLHEPLEQGFIITKRAGGNSTAKKFSEYMRTKKARAIMVKYGFVLPGEK